ncbi:MAG: N-acetyltransferase [Methylobacteriaceae bacterium]|jgi:predicted N-acetyltransferase YhbS|nr:N-acetyltransferase [Methylobacteriaceae bacterium]
MPDDVLRPERPEDYRAVERLTRDAFRDAPHADGKEALLARRLRAVAAFVPGLDFVAEREGAVIGNIMYSRSHVAGRSGAGWETLTLGPLSIAPRHQRQGVGSALVRRTLGIARDMGFRAVILFGHEHYYPRFGFADAARYGITTADGKNFPAFMALPLFDGALAAVSGRFLHDPVFDSLDKADAEAFNRSLDAPG